LRTRAQVPEQIARDHFPPGEGIDWSRPGDFILVRGTSWRSRIASGYARLRARGREERQCAQWNHAALITGTDGAIVEAGTAGVVLTHLEKYRDDDYRYVATSATPEQRWLAIRFARASVGSRYGNLLLANLVVSPLTRGRVRFENPGCEMCGTLVARALAHAGESFARRPTDMLPADLAVHYGVGLPPPSQ
jgi:hypothetical protein